MATDCKSVRASVRRFKSCLLHHLSGCSSTVEFQPSKLAVRVRFPSPAPNFSHQLISPIDELTQHRLKIISIDELKKALPGYSPEKADDFHTESAKIANKLFDQELKKIKNQEVVLMCGGSASGKSEFIEKFFITEKFDGMIFDSTLSKIDGAEIKIKQIKKSQNTPIVCFILPDDLRRCFAAFHKRDRKIPEGRFYETHCGAREVALWINKNYPEIEILIYQNLYQPDN
jgi:hypothetical protein